MADDAATSDRERLDSLLAAMPRIAEAVKAFPEGVQSQAFETLMAELRGTSAPNRSTTKTSATRKRIAARGSKEAPSKGVRRRSGGPTTVKDLDLTPKGKESLKAFAEQKKPKTNHDRNILSVYYLLTIIGLEAVTINHVYTCYKDLRWREPGTLSNSLALTANRKRYLDTSNLNDIRLMPAGRNHVEHDLPAKKKGK